MSSSFVNPAETPVTAFARRARRSPCLLRSGPLSPDRLMVTVPSLTSMGNPGNTAWLTLPFGPSAVNWPSATATFVPEGSLIGIFPIRDMGLLASSYALSLPDFAEQLAADPALARLAVRQEPLGRRDDRDPQAVPYRLDVVS